MSAGNKEKKSSDRALATKNHIETSFLSLMRHHHWDRITVKQLCDEAAVTRGTFYQYFSGITDLMETIENDTICEIQTTLSKAMQTFKPSNVLFTSDFDRDFNIKPSRFTITWFQYCQENSEKLYSLLNLEYSEHLFVNRVEQIIAHHLSYTMKCEGLPNDVFRRQYLNLYTGLYIKAFYSWVNDEEMKLLSPEDMALVVDSIRTGGLYAARRTRMETFK